MLVTVIAESAPISGGVWPAGTVLECPDPEAARAIAAGLATPGRQDVAEKKPAKKAPAAPPAPPEDDAPVGLAAKSPSPRRKK